MGGGGDEDDRRELERLERDLAAIDARWSAEGYQQRTSSKVLDDERATRTELQLRIMKLEAALKSSSATPALGTGSVRANTGIGWQPLALFEVPPRLEEKSALPPAQLDVASAAAALRDLAELKGILFEEFASRWGKQAWFELYEVIRELSADWHEVEGARRLLAAAFRSTGGDTAAAALTPPPANQDFIPRVLTGPFLTDATELPDEVTGLTPTQTAVLRVLRECAPETGAFVSLASVLAEVRESLPDFAEAALVHECVALGHPALRPIPLVAFQGFAARLEPTATFTHVRLTREGREVAEGAFPVPLLLTNGAAGNGTCILPYPAHELARACLQLAKVRLTRPDELAELLQGVRLPLGVAVSRAAPVLLTPELQRVDVSASMQFHIVVSQRRARILVHRLPFPMRVADLRENLERLAKSGGLDGLLSVTDESSADEQRLSLEFEHVVFLVPASEQLRSSRVLTARYPVALRVAGGNSPPLSELLQVFIESRKEAAVKKLDAVVARATQRAQELEGVCLALEMLDRVQGVLRDAFSDDEAVTALKACMRADDRDHLQHLPFKPSHPYETGFTEVQARYLVKQRKLAHRSKEASHLDWSRALDEVVEAKTRLSGRPHVMALVCEELEAAASRFKEWSP